MQLKISQFSRNEYTEFISNFEVPLPDEIKFFMLEKNELKTGKQHEKWIKKLG